MTLPPGAYRFTNVDVAVTSPQSRVCWGTLEGEAGPLWNHGVTLDPNLLQGGRTLTGTSFILKLDWGFL